MAVCADLPLHALYPTMLSAWEMPSDPLACLIPWLPRSMAATLFWSDLRIHFNGVIAEAGRGTLCPHGASPSRCSSWRGGSGSTRMTQTDIGPRGQLPDCQDPAGPGRSAAAPVRAGKASASPVSRTGQGGGVFEV